MLDKGYEVHGVIRRASTFNTERINHLYQDPHINGVRLFLHYGDIADSTNLIKLLYRIQPDEIYHLAAQSHVRVSFDIPEYTGDVSGLGTIRILEAIRETGLKSKFYQASSSEMYGKVQAVPQRETTPFYPRSPYGAAKVYAYWDPSITAKATVSSRAMAFSSITSRRAEEKPLSPVKSPEPRRGSKPAWKRKSTLAISKPNVIGDMPRNTSRPCG